MRKQLNGKLVAGIAGGLLLAGVAVHVVHGVQVRRGAQALLPLAAAAEEGGDLTTAARYLGDYLTLVPDDCDVQARYGLLLARLPTPALRARALDALEQVLREDPGRADLRRQVVRLALDLGRFSAAQPHVAVLLKSTPGDAELLYWQGRCREVGKDYAAAVDSYAQAVRHDPQAIDGYVRQARLLRRQLGRPAQAKQVMDRLPALNEQSARAHLERGRYHKEFGEYKEADADLARARALAPDEADVLLASAEVARARGQLNEARNYLWRCRELHPQDRGVTLALSELEAQAGRPREAIACVRQGLQAAPEQLDLLLALAELLLQENEQAEVHALLPRLERAGCSPEEFHYLVGRLQMREEQWAAAAQRLEDVRRRLGAEELVGRVALYLGYCYAQLGDTDRAADNYHRAIDEDPFNPAPHLALASALREAGRLGEAAGECWQAMKLRNPPTAGWLLLTHILVQRNQAPSTGAPDWAEAERALARAEQAYPESPEVLTLRAEVLRGRGQSAEARRLLEDAHGLHPNQIDVIAALADLLEAEEQWDGALRLLQEARENLGDRVDLRLAWARHWARRGSPETPVQLATVTRDLEQFSLAEQVELLRGLAAITSGAGDSRAANHFWAQLARRQPNDLRVRLQLFDDAVKDEDDAAQQRLLAEIRRIEGEDGSLWRYAEAMRALARAQRGDRSGIGAARRRLSEVAARRRSWARVPLLAANFDELEANPRQAMEHYRRAIELGDHQPDVLRRAAQLAAEQAREAKPRGKPSK